MPQPSYSAAGPAHGAAKGRAAAPGSYAGPAARILALAFARVDALAMGAAAGLVCGLLIFAATAWLLVEGGPVVGPTLSLVAQYFPGFSVTWRGALVGLLYGTAAGFLAGWTLASMRNLGVRLFLRYARLRAEREARRHFLDYV